MVDQNKTPSPFMPTEPLTAARLEAYLKGTLTPEEMHDVELHLEADAMDREAMEGFMEHPEAALPSQLLGDGPRGRSGGSGRTVLWALLLLSIPAAWLAHSLWNGGPAGPDGNTTTPAISHTDATDEGHVQTMADAVIVPAELPESLHIGHGPEDRHRLTAAGDIVPADRPADVNTLQQRRTEPDRLRNGLEARPLRRSKPSRQLVFLHDLKLVHPSELHATAPVMERNPGGVPASHAAPEGSPDEPRAKRMMGYLSFMDEALARFARSDHKGCLEDMRFLLDQYPDDVNALFYAGLSSHNLGRLDEAIIHLHAAARHSVDVFDEEAAWYHALSVERRDGRDAAAPLLKRIGDEGGYYSIRASERSGAR